MRSWLGCWCLLALAACGDGATPTLDGGPADSGANVVDAAVPADALDAAGLDATPLPLCTEGGAQYDCTFNGGGDCFLPPGSALTGADGVTPADLACAPLAITTSTATIAVTGLARDALDESPIAGSIAAFPSFDFGAPSATAASDGAGAYALNLPVGTPSRLSWRVLAAGQLDTYTISRPIVVTGAPQVRNLISMTLGTANQLATFVGVNRVPSSTVVFGLVLDCSGHAVAHAVVTLSTASSAGDVCPSFVTAAKPYYFSTAAPNLPATRTQRVETNLDGQYLIFDVPPLAAGQTYLLQAWGYPTAADVAQGFPGLVLIAEEPIPAPADSVIVISTLPNQN